MATIKTKPGELPVLLSACAPINGTAITQQFSARSPAIMMTIMMTIMTAITQPGMHPTFKDIIQPGIQPTMHTGKVHTGKYA